MPSTLQFLVDGPVSNVYRKAFIQTRSATTGLYSGTWVDISAYVKRWGSLEIAIDDTRFNNFTDRGCNLTVQNNDGSFSHHSNPSSLWFGTLTRYRTLLRIDAAYLDTDLTTTVPATPTAGIFILDQEIGIQSASNEVYLRGSSLKSVFDEVRADSVTRLFTTATWKAGDIIATLRDHSDGAGQNVFSGFITKTSWTIDTTSTNPYLLNTDTVLEISAWELMNKLAEAEGYVVLLTRTGGIEFRPRTARQGSSQFSFQGQHTSRPNIIQVTDYREAYDKFYSYYSLKYLPADTSTSFARAGTVTVINPTNPSWVNGQRTYEFENLLPQNAATAQTIVNNLYSISSAGVPQDISIECGFVPSLNVMDRVDITYLSYDLGNQSLWDVMTWNTDVWSKEGFNFDLNSTSAFLTAVRLNIDEMKHNFTARFI